jgi:type I restriction enzyme S subunit
MVTTRATLGSVALAARPTATNQGFKSVVFGQSGEPSFYFHYFQMLLPELIRRSSGTTFLEISAEQFGQMAIPVPPIAEQRRIAEILDTADEAIRSSERLIVKLDQVKQGLLHDLLTRGMDSNGRLRADYTREPGLYRDTRLGPIPTDWKVHLLDEVSVRGRGHTPNKDITAYWNGGIRWVSLADSARLDKIYITETDKEISDLGIANSSAVKHRAGTVILSRDAGVGKSAILAQGMAVSQHFMAWTCGVELDNHYLYYWLQFMKPRFEAIAMGSTIKTIGLPFFRRLSIPLPRIDQQKAAAAQLLAADADIARHQVEARKQRVLKLGLMNDLLTGRVRVGASE